jgi:hypothetical protein
VNLEQQSFSPRVLARDVFQLIDWKTFQKQVQSSISGSDLRPTARYALQSPRPPQRRAHADLVDWIHLYGRHAFNHMVDVLGEQSADPTLEELNNAVKKAGERFDRIEVICALAAVVLRNMQASSHAQTILASTFGIEGAEPSTEEDENFGSKVFSNYRPPEAQAKPAVAQRTLHAQPKKSRSPRYRKQSTSTPPEIEAVEERPLSKAGSSSAGVISRRQLPLTELQKSEGFTTDGPLVGALIANGVLVNSNLEYVKKTADMRPCLVLAQNHREKDLLLVRGIYDAASSKNATLMRPLNEWRSLGLRKKSSISLDVDRARIVGDLELLRQEVDVEFWNALF